MAFHASSSLMSSMRQAAVCANDSARLFTLAHYSSRCKRPLRASIILTCTCCLHISICATCTFRYVQLARFEMCNLHISSYLHMLLLGNLQHIA